MAKIVQNRLFESLGVKCTLPAESVWIAKQVLFVSTVVTGFDAKRIQFVAPQSPAAFLTYHSLPCGSHCIPLFQLQEAHRACAMSSPLHSAQVFWFHCSLARGMEAVRGKRANALADAASEGTRTVERGKRVDLRVKKVQAKRIPRANAEGPSW